MKIGDIVKVKEPDGTYGFYRFIAWGRSGTQEVIIERKDTPPPKSMFLGEVSLVSIEELFRAYEDVCQRLKEAEKAYRTLRQEHIDIVNNAQTHLRGPF